MPQHIQYSIQLRWHWYMQYRKYNTRNDANKKRIFKKHQKGVSKNSNHARALLTAQFY
jgi:hypothetical protein